MKRVSLKKHPSFGRNCISVLLPALLGILYFGSPVFADITVTGNITPSDPSASRSQVAVGNTADGTMTIDGGSDLHSYESWIGYNSGVSGVVNVNGSGSTWDIHTITYIMGKRYEFDEELYVGYAGDGTLQIANGGKTFNGKGYVGYSAGSTGTVTVDGAGSTWTNSDSLEVGRDGTGRLNVFNRGRVTSAYSYVGAYSGSTGMVTVDGAGSRWTNDGNLFLGNSGEGTLTVTHGGTVSSGSTYIGNGSRPASAGTATVDGTGSFLSNSSSLNVRNGTLTVTNGGNVSNPNGYISAFYNSTADVTVDGAGSTWTNSTSLYIGDNDSTDDSTLNVINGGKVSSGSSYIANAIGTTATATVDGAGSTWTNSGTMYVGRGRDSNATLNITNGGRVSTSSAYLAYEFGSIGTVTVDGAGSTLTSSNFLYLFRDSSLHISNGGLVSVAGLLAIGYYDYADSFITMKDGGMLALYGDADNSLAEFLDLIYGSGAILYWDASVSDWSDISLATMGRDYRLEYLTEGELAGYTVLTVGVVPEPATLLLFGLGAIAIRRKQSR